MKMNIKKLSTSTLAFCIGVSAAVGISSSLNWIDSSQSVARQDSSRGQRSPSSLDEVKKDVVNEPATSEGFRNAIGLHGSNAISDESDQFVIREKYLQGSKEEPTTVGRESNVASLEMRNLASDPNIAFGPAAQDLEADAK